VDERGPARHAGIEPSDVITNFDGQDIKVLGDLPTVVRITPVGKPVGVIIIRHGNEEQLTLTVGDNSNWFDRYVDAHGGCAFFLTPRDFNSLWQEDNALGALNLASRSLEHGQYNIYLFGKPLAEWSDNEVTNALRTVDKCAPNLASRFEQQLGEIIGAARRAQAERQASKLRKQTDLNNNAADEAKGYRHISVDDFLLDGKVLTDKEAKIAINGVYLREGNLDYVFTSRRAAVMDRDGQAQPNVPILTDGATREFRQQQLNCLSNPGCASFGREVTVLGHASICKLTNAFGVERDTPCVDVEDGRFAPDL
jgi:hypothetical protein